MTSGKRKTYTLLAILLGFCSSKGEKDFTPDDIGFLAELPLAELLEQKKILMCDNSSKPEKEPKALPLVGIPPEKEVKFKGLHKLPARKTFHEYDYDDEKGWVYKKKKEKNKYHDILNTSITALSYLAFGGYLLCMIVSSLREKKRRLMAAYPIGSQSHNQFTNVLQQYVTRRPVRIRFPAVTVHHGKRKRRKRSDNSPYSFHRKGKVTWDEGEEEETFSIINVIDYVEALSQTARGGN